MPDAVWHPLAVTGVDLYRDTAGKVGGPTPVWGTEGHGRGTAAARWLAERGATRVVLATDLLHVSESLDPTQLSPVYEGLAGAGSR